MTSMLVVLMVAVVVTAALVSVIAWRYASDARRRDVARAALLRHAATSEGWDDRIDQEALVMLDAGPAPAIDQMFANDVRPAAAPAHAWIAAAAVAIVMALVAATLVARRVDAPADRTSDVTAPAAQAPVPVALTALSHQRDRTGTLMVSGAVQNPSGAPSLDHLMAVIDALDDHDRVVTTVTAGVDAPVLMAGDATRFLVGIPRSDDVARYRVRFRLRDGAAIEHRDERRR